VQGGKLASIADDFEAAMTPEEKERLFAAIDYQENAPPTTYPMHYVENVVHFKLKKLLLRVQDDTLKRCEY
jgi:vacuolar protein sorting-associated protein 13A/C